MTATRRRDAATTAGLDAHTARAELSEREKQLAAAIVTLRTDDHLSLRQIASLVGVSKDTVARRIAEDEARKNEGGN